MSGNNTRFLVVEKHLDEASNGIPGGHRLVDSADTLEELIDRVEEKTGAGFDSSEVEMLADGRGTTGGENDGP